MVPTGQHVLAPLQRERARLWLGRCYKAFGSVGGSASARRRDASACEPARGAHRSQRFGQLRACWYPHPSFTAPSRSRDQDSILRHARVGVERTT